MIQYVTYCVTVYMTHHPLYVLFCSVGSKFHINTIHEPVECPVSRVSNVGGGLSYYCIIVALCYIIVALYCIMVTGKSCVYVHPVIGSSHC